MPNGRESNGDYRKPIALPMPIGAAGADYVSSSTAEVAVGPPGTFGENAPTPWYLDFSGVWSRHRRAILWATVFGIVLGYLVGTLFSTKYWTVDARLRLSSPPIS